MNESLMRESWRRDDTAIQRRVADLKAAGLNPVLAAGSGASNSGPIRLAPTELSSPDLSRAYSAAIQSRVSAKTAADAQVAQLNVGAAEAEAKARAVLADKEARFNSALIPYQDSLAENEAKAMAARQAAASSAQMQAIAQAQEAEAKARIAQHDAAILDKYPDMLSTSSSGIKDLMGGFGMIGSFLDKVGKYQFVPKNSN